jgi:NAD(P) transhydrogenase subunit beta
VESPTISTIYLLSIILFILGLKRLSHPDTAKKGNTIAYIGMGLAIVVTILFPFEGANNNYGFIIGGLILGSIIGFIAAKKK